MQLLAMAVEVEEGPGAEEEVAPPPFSQPVTIAQRLEQGFEAVQVGLGGVPHGPDRSARSEISRQIDSDGM